MNENLKMGLSQAKALESIWRPGVTGPAIEQHLRDIIGPGNPGNIFHGLKCIGKESKRDKSINREDLMWVLCCWGICFDSIRPNRPNPHSGKDAAQELIHRGRGEDAILFAAGRSENDVRVSFRPIPEDLLKRL